MKRRSSFSPLLRPSTILATILPPRHDPSMDEPALLALGARGLRWRRMALSTWRDCLNFDVLAVQGFVFLTSSAAILFV